MIHNIQPGGKWQHPNLLLSIKAQHNTINTQFTRYSVITSAALKIGLNIGEDVYHLLWTDQALSIRQIKMLEPEVKVNHFAQITSITRKNRLAGLLNSMRLHFPKEYNFYPQSWVMPQDFGRMTKKHSKGKVYIVKPENGCQGQGIYLTQNPYKLQYERNVIIQQYIGSPMLIDGLKFDIRIYVLVTCVQPLRIFIYKEGIVRFATEKYIKPAQGNLDDRFKHLTNYAINKQHENFCIQEQEGQKGHKRLLSKVFKNEQYKDFMDKVTKIVMKTIITGVPILQNAFTQCKKSDPNSCFQLLGFDILMTDKKEPILLEVNQNSSLNTDTQFDLKLKFDLVKNILEMVTGGYRCNSQDKFEAKIKLKDRHEAATKGNFNRIYPCQNLQDTEKYDCFLAKSINLYRERFGLNMVRSGKVGKEILRQQQTSLAWNEQPSHYTHAKIEKVYGGSTGGNLSLLNSRGAKSSTHKKRLIFL